MKRALLALLICLALIPAAARAEDKKPDATPSFYIAALYEKLLGRTPDFGQWVAQSPKYQSAELYERANIMDSNVKQLRDTFDLLTVAEPIHVNVRAKISGYSPLGQGFLVQNFNDMTFFNYTYLGEHYALIPNGMAKYQWLKTPASLADSIMRETDNGQQVHMTLTLIPLAADGKDMEINNVKYHLIMADISKIQMWSKDGHEAIWDTEIADTDATKKQVLGLHP